MERAQDLNNLTKKLNPKNNGLVITCLIILFHVVGLIGLSFPSSRPLFLTLVPWHLLLMFLLIIVNHQNKRNSFFFFVLTIFSLGFFAEWIGVHTNILFGHYHYGRTLGIQVLSIPLTMGLNWFALIYITGVLTEKVRLKSSWARIICGSFLLVFLDVLIEPVAMRFDYWHWQNNTIPLGNYLGWFVVSALMLYLFERFNFKKQNWAGPILLLVQFIFFGILDLVK